MDKPLSDMVDLIGSPLFASPGMSAGAQKSADFVNEIKLFKSQALVDPAFWEVCGASFADTGPSWAIDFLATRTIAAWPTRDSLAVVSGNVGSVMRFLPDAYAVVPGLLVDEVAWLDARGEGGQVDRGRGRVARRRGEGGRVDRGRGRVARRRGEGDQVDRACQGRR
ncbi:MAG: hypothetical protein FJ087_21720, partial [Deltaproteobacteria bacterium]|nr:hypothetical protein [Deltaproteobacteria bacterium]